MNGAPGCGKTTFEKYVQEIIGGEDVRIFSTVDAVKVAAKYLGWDGTKTPKNRKFLSDLKQLWIEWDDGVMKDIKRRVENVRKSYEIYDMPADQAIIFIDSREPLEIDRMKRELGARTILINRGPRAMYEEILNSSDRDVDKYDYDIYIDNIGDLDMLRKAADEFIDLEGIRKP